MEKPTNQYNSSKAGNDKKGVNISIGDNSIMIEDGYDRITWFPEPVDDLEKNKSDLK